MTDRAQPGAIDSLIRNDELAQVFGRFSEGFVVPGSDPTPAAQRRADIDETALAAFSLTTSPSSLDVTVAPGEAFISGWVCRDVSTTVTLPADSTVDIVVGFDPDAIFDPQVDADRDAADETVVDLAGNVDATTPTTTVHQLTTDGSGVTSNERVATVGSSASVNTLETDNFGNNATESVQDIVGGLITGQNDANVTYDDDTDQLSIDVSTRTNEEVQDIVASFVSSDSNLSWSYDDTNDTLTVSLSDSISVNNLEAGSVTFNQDITGADNNTVTSLSDPVRVTEDAVTFTESDVQTQLTDCQISSGSISLVNPSTTTTGQTANEFGPLASADITDNGQDDIVFTDSNNNLKYYDTANDSATDIGDKTFKSVGIGDVKDDGRDDVVFLDQNNDIRYYLPANDTIQNTQEQGELVAVGDVTDDGRDDIIFIDSNANLKYYDEIGSVVTDTSATANSTVGLAVGDVTGDGRDDIVFSDNNTNLKYYDAANDTVTDTGETPSNFIEVGDVTGDGQADIVFRDNNTNTLVYYDVANGTATNTGLDVFSQPVIGDVTGNGRANIVFIDGDNIKYYDVANDTTTDVGVDGSLNSPAVGDITGDGQDDIVFGDINENLKYRSLVKSKSGDALVSFGSDVPSDIISWDLATFQATEDGETVTVDVEDGNGTVLFTDVGPDFDISTIDNSKNVKLRANLSRNNTANNPTLDYAALRFTR